MGDVVCGDHGVWGLRCIGVAVCRGRGVWGMQCVGVAVCEGGGVWGLRCTGWPYVELAVCAVAFLRVQY